MHKSLTISEKGQLNNQEVKIIPIKDVAGSLSSFVKYDKYMDTDFNDLREQAWNRYISEKYTK